MPSLLYDIYRQCSGVSINSKNINPGDLFVGIKGQRTNGSMFAKEALDIGAKYAIVDDECYQGKDPRIIPVGDTLATLVNLAKEHRSYFNIPFIAVTGSSGKTTVKEMLKTILESRYKTFATEGNFNSHIGTPLSILSISLNTEIAIIEMGAKHLGDIKFLCNITKPTHGIITNVREVHLETFGNIDIIYKTKTELYDYLIKNRGMIFVNKMDTNLINRIANYDNVLKFDPENSKIYFEIGNHSPFYSAIKGKERIITNILGNYNFINISLAINVASFFSIEADDAVEQLIKFKGASNRLEIINNRRNTIILDAYNSNPQSVKEALNVLDEFNKKNKIVILSDMKEMGEKSDKKHKEIIDLTIDKYNKVLYCGAELCKNKTESNNAKYFYTKDQLELYLKSKPIIDSTILIKGSRYFKMETLADLL